MSRRRDRIKNFISTSDKRIGLDQLARFWALKFLTECSGLSQCMGEGGFTFRSDVARFIGAEDPCDNNPDSIKKVQSELQHQYSVYRGVLPGIPVLLKKNIDALQTLFNLDANEVQILLFWIVLSSVQAFEDFLDGLGYIDEVSVYQIISQLTGLTFEQVRLAHTYRSTLLRSGLMERAQGRGVFSQYFSFSSRSVLMRLMGHDGPIADLFREFVHQVEHPSVSIDDYPYLNQHIELLMSLLGKVLQTPGKASCNVFVYGMPGTGKTQLPRAIGAHLNIPVYEIPAYDEDGDPVGAGRRLRSLRLAHSMFSHIPSLIVIDEVEELLDYDGFKPRFYCGSTVTKSSLTSLMDELKSPTFWISNSSTIDPALARRFDLVIAMPQPPQSYRKSMLEKLDGSGLLSPDLMQQISSMPMLSPADVERVMRIMAQVQDDIAPEYREQTLYMLLNSRLKLQSLPALQTSSRSAIPDDYDLRHLNASLDIDTLAERLAEGQQANLCLYGPPGTGKSAFGQWLARKIDKPLLVRRASDILDKYVGETEKRISEMFHEAETQNGILLVDEVDGFFQNRTMLQSSWQINMVNEFLTSMETFNGVFIATTNLVSMLDEAFMRRFDARIRFDYLCKAQVIDLFKRLASDLNLSDCDVRSDEDFQTLTCLTPGDFAVIRRRHRFNPVLDRQALLAALHHEQSYKKDHKRRSIGFMSAVS